jgi:hypothetical protein
MGQDLTLTTLTAPAGAPAFGVGAAKSGTHALATMFRVRSAHEPQAIALLNLILERHRARISEEVFAQFVGKIIARLNLELNVSQINGYLIKTLVALYPTARYVLTIRDCASWLRSFVNHQTKRPVGQGRFWHAFRELRFKPDEHPHWPEERVLAEHGLYSLDAYLSYWLWHNSEVLKAVSADRLLVVPTAWLAQDSEMIAAFLNIKSGVVDHVQWNEFRGRYVGSPLDRMDADYVRVRTTACARALIASAPGRLSADVARYLITGDRS